MADSRTQLRSFALKSLHSQANLTSIIEFLQQTTTFLSQPSLEAGRLINHPLFTRHNQGSLPFATQASNSQDRHNHLYIGDIAGLIDQIKERILKQRNLLSPQLIKKLETNRTALSLANLSYRPKLIEAGHETKLIESKKELIELINPLLKALNKLISQGRTQIPEEEVAESLTEERAIKPDQLEAIFKTQAIELTIVHLTQVITPQLPIFIELNLGEDQVKAGVLRTAIEQLLRTEHFADVHQIVETVLLTDPAIALQIVDGQLVIPPSSWQVFDQHPQTTTFINGFITAFSTNLTNQLEKRAESGGDDWQEQAVVPTTASSEAPTPLEVGLVDVVVQNQAEAARMAAIIKINLEQFYGLPLPPEVEMEIFNEILILFNNLTPEQRQQLFANPVSRLKLLRQLYTQINHNPRIRPLLEKAVQDYLETLGLDDKKRFVDSLKNSQTGGDFSYLLNHHLKDSKLDERFKAIASLPSFSGDSREQLIQSLLALPRFSDLTRTRIDAENIIATIDSLIALKYSPQFITLLDHGRFEIIFRLGLNKQEFAHIKNHLIPLFQAYWQMRRAELTKKYGHQVGVEQQAVTSQQQAEIREQKPDAFGQNHLAPIAGIRGTAEKEGGTPEDFVAATSTPYGDNSKIEKSKIDYIKQLKKQIYSEELWRNLSQTEKEALYEFYGYGDQITAYQQENFIPPELTYTDLSLVTPAQPIVFYQPQTASSPAQRRNLPALIPPVISPMGNIHPAAFLRPPSASGIGQRVRQTLSRTTKKVIKKAGDAAGSLAYKGLTALSNYVVPGSGVVLKMLPKKYQKKLGRGAILAVLAGIIPAIVTGVVWVASTLAKIGSFIGGAIAGPLGAVAGTWLGFGIEKTIGTGWKKLWGLDSTTASPTAARYIAGKPLQSLASQQASLAAKTSVSSKLMAQQAAKFFAGPGLAAPIIGISATAAGLIFSQYLINAAFLADFSRVSPLSTYSGIERKISKYLSIEKRINVLGCPDNKCENPSFPFSAEYTITIKPKENYTIVITEFSDVIEVHHNDDKYGGNPPNIPDETKTMSSFPQLSTEEGRTLGPGEELTLAYRKTFDSKYNHSNILNTITLNFYYTNSSESGADNAITGEILTLGEPPSGQGCWPTSGTISQLPWGDWSHGKMDAYDIANAEGTPVYAPFAGDLCAAHVDAGYGNHMILSTDTGNFLFAHFSGMIINSGCKDVAEGQMIGRMGSTGNSTGSHLHYEVQRSGGWFRASPPSTLQAMVPDPNIGINQPVRTCYE